MIDSFVLGGCLQPHILSKSRMTVVVNCTLGRNQSRLYRIYYVGGSRSTVPVISSTLPVRLSGLSPDLTYAITVEAENSEGLWENSSTIEVTTNKIGEQHVTLQSYT